MTSGHIVDYQTVDKSPKIMHSLVLNLILDALPVRKIFLDN